MNITIVGAGNIGTQFAVHCAAKGNKVTIFTKKEINKELSIVDKQNNVLLKAEIGTITNNPKVAFENADLIFVTVPAFAMENTSNIIYPYTKEKQIIALIPGTGGGEMAFKKCLDKGAIIFGLQRVPSVARLVDYGKTVCATGYRDTLHGSCLPHSETDKCCRIISEIFDKDCVSLPDYLNLTLTPSNPILHTTRLKTIFKDYYDGKEYDEVPLFYEDWNDESSELLLKCDDEVQQICKALNDFNLSYVKSLKIHYESNNAIELTNKLRSIEGFKGLKSPVIEINGKFVPDFDSRYFTADFNFGLQILIEIADLLNVDVPNMKETMKWYTNLNKYDKNFDFKHYGIETLEDFEKVYKK